MRNFFGGLLATLAAEFIFNFLGTAERVQQVTGVLWAMWPVIGLALACAAAALLAPAVTNRVRSAYQWCKAKRPSNRFHADVREIANLHSRWTDLQENPGLAGEEDRLLLVNDAHILFGKHGIPAPDIRDSDAAWRLFLLFALVTSKAGDLDKAHKIRDEIRSELRESSGQ